MSKKVSLDEKINRIKRLETLFIDGFRFKKFQDNGKSFSQENVIKSMLKGKDTMAIMPTGAGKSMIFQDAAFCQEEGITLVISPLVALIHDQVKKYNDKFERLLDYEDKYKEYCEIASEKFDGAIPRAIVPGYKGCYAEALFREISSPKLYKEDFEDKDVKVKYTLLYVSPERLCNGKFMSAFMSAIKKGRISVSLVVIDECHCISRWGYDFRPAYLNIVRWIATCERVVGKRLPKALFSATATETDIKLIESTLDIKDADKFISRERNENIDISIREVKEGTLENALMNVLFKDEKDNYRKAIVFCNNRMKVEDLYKAIKSKMDNDKAVVMYHSKLYKTVRQENAEHFCMPNEKGGAKIMIATEGFSMGVDCADVDLIIHYMPENIEQYYQEIGRAGRWDKSENRTAKAILLYKAGGTFEAGSMVNVSKWSAALKQIDDERSSAMDLDAKNKKLLTLFDLYRFCCINDMAKKGIGAGDNCNYIVADLVKKYFEKSIFDDITIKDMLEKIEELSNEICEIYDSEIKKKDRKIKELKSFYGVNVNEIEEKIRKVDELAKIYENDDTMADSAERLKEFCGKEKERLKKQKEKYKEKGRKEREEGETKNKIASVKKSKEGIEEYKEKIKDAPLKAKKILKECFKDDKNILDVMSDFTQDIKKKSKEEQNLKVINTLVARKLRTDRDIQLGGLYDFTEEEIKRDIPRKEVKAPDFELENFYIARNTLFVYVYDAVNPKEESDYIKEQYATWCADNVQEAEKVELIYAVRFKTVENSSKKKSKAIEQYYVAGIYYVTGTKDIKRLSKKNEENLAEILNCKVESVRRIEEHLECVVNKIRNRKRKSLKGTFDSLRMSKEENKDLLNTFYFEGKSSRRVEFILERKDGSAAGDRAISYFDMCVLDAICTLAAEEKPVYLQSIWKMLCGREDVEISSNGRIKRILQESIDKMSNLTLYIYDTKLGCFNDDFLKINKKSKGYIVDEKPILYQYAEEHNGMIASMAIRNFNAGLYFPVDDKDMNAEKFEGLELPRNPKKKYENNKSNYNEGEDDKEAINKLTEEGLHYATVENVVLIHYLCHRAYIYRHSRLINKINYDSIINVVGNEMTAYHRNKRYVRTVANAVIPHVLQDILYESEIKEY